MSETSRSWMSDSTFADVLNDEFALALDVDDNNTYCQKAHQHCVRAPLGPGAVNSAPHAKSLLDAARRVEITVAVEGGRTRRFFMTRHYEGHVPFGLKLHSCRGVTTVIDVQPSSLADAAGLECGMQVLTIVDQDTESTDRVPVGLFCSHPTPKDPDGCGLEIDERGVVTKLIQGGLASRWGEFKVGDQIETISNGTACGRQAHSNFVEGTCLADYLQPGKNAYLCIVRRAQCSPNRTPVTLMRRNQASKPRFTTEREVAEALAHAGDYLAGRM